MKKILMIVMILLISVCATIAQETYSLIKVKEITNAKKPGKLYMRNDILPYDDISGNQLEIDAQGNWYIYNWDSQLLYEVESETLTTKQEIRLQLPFLAGVSKITEKTYEFSWAMSTYMIIDKQTNEAIISVSLNDMLQNSTRSFYYDEGSNILFFTDDKYKLHSIVNPGTDEAVNKANYRNPEQTSAMFSEESGMDLHGLTRDEKGNLYVDGKKYYWFGLMIGNCTYQFVDTRTTLVYDGKKETFIKLDKMPEEQHESTAVHPSGDIYILRYNKETDKHVLYKIENTWDMEAKQAWETRSK